MVQGNVCCLIPPTSSISFTVHRSSSSDTDLLKRTYTYQSSLQKSLKSQKNCIYFSLRQKRFSRLCVSDLVVLKYLRNSTNYLLHIFVPHVPYRYIKVLRTNLLSKLSSIVRIFHVNKPLGHFLFGFLPAYTLQSCSHFR